MSTDTLDKAKAVFDDYVIERPFWVALAAWATEELRGAMQLARLPVKAEGRAKTIGSTIGKVYRKPRDYDVLEKFEDLAGVRALIPFQDSVDAVVEAIKLIEGWSVEDDDPKTPAPDKLAYQARHLAVDLDEAVGPERTRLVRPRVVRFEVQIQTYAQSLWANSSHLVTYKKDLPPEIQRRVNRLVVLTELFDDQIVAAREAALDVADHVDIIWSELQRFFSALTGQPSTSGEPLDLLALLLPPGVAELDGYTDKLDHFVTDEWEPLTYVLNEEVEARGQPLLSRPEVIMVFERITNAPFATKQAWESRYPVYLFDELRAIWPSNLSGV